jgi:hypothetical protein
VNHKLSENAINQSFINSDLPIDQWEGYLYACRQFNIIKQPTYKKHILIEIGGSQGFFGSHTPRAYAGKTDGYQFRDSLGQDIMRNPASITLRYADNVYAVNANFFYGLFSLTVQSIGKEKFLSILYLPEDFDFQVCLNEALRMMEDKSEIFKDCRRKNELQNNINNSNASKHLRR